MRFRFNNSSELLVASSEEKMGMHFLATRHCFYSPLATSHSLLVTGFNYGFH